MSVLIMNKEDCCGCSACEAICPVDAIKMKLDESGFYYPSVDKDRCTECGMCEKVCQVMA